MFTPLGRKQDEWVVNWLFTTEKATNPPPMVNTATKIEIMKFQSFQSSFRRSLMFGHDLSIITEPMKGRRKIQADTIQDGQPQIMNQPAK